VRRDITQDADRPHYYSQFWIDVARGEEKSSGRPASAIAAPTEADVDEAGADDLLMDEITPRLERTERTEPKKPAAKPTEKKPETAGRSTLTSFADLANIANIDMLMKSSAELGDDVTPDIEAAATPGVDEDTTPSFQFETADEESPEAEAEAEADDTDTFGYEDEDEEDDWGSRRKPKQTKPKRRERRDY